MSQPNQKPSGTSLKRRLWNKHSTSSQQFKQYQLQNTTQQEQLPNTHSTSQQRPQGQLYPKQSQPKLSRSQEIRQNQLDGPRSSINFNKIHGTKYHQNGNKSITGEGAKQLQKKPLQQKERILKRQPSYGNVNAAMHMLNINRENVSSRRSSLVSNSSSLYNHHSSIISDDNFNSGKSVLISIDKARIFTYNAYAPSQLRRATSMDSMYSLRRVDSIESIRSNITEILSNDGGDDALDAVQDYDNDDTNSISSRRRNLGSKGRLIAHGILQIYEIEAGVTYLSCGGGSKTTRETFVHPLLPRLKVFKVNDYTFILMLSHPERFWKIIFEIQNSVMKNNPDDYMSLIEEMEKIFKKSCCFIDMFPTGSLMAVLSPIQLKLQQVSLKEPVYIPKKTQKISESNPQQHPQQQQRNASSRASFENSSNKSLSHSQPTQSQQQALEQQQQQIPKITQNDYKLPSDASNSSSLANRKNKGHLGNRLSKFFKTKTKQRPGAGAKREENGDAGYYTAGANVSGNANDMESSPSNYSVTAGTNLIDNSSANMLKSNLVDNNSTVATDYNTYIDKLIEEKIEEKVRNQLKKENKKDVLKYANNEGNEDSHHHLDFDAVEEEPRFGTENAEEPEEPDRLRDLAEEENELQRVPSNASSISSDDSLLDEIAEEDDDFQNPQLLKDLTVKLNNDVSTEIFQLKRRSAAHYDKDYVVAKFQSQYANNKENLPDKKKEKRSSLYLNTTSWMDLNDKEANKRKLREEEEDDDFDDDENLEILRSINPSAPELPELRFPTRQASSSKPTARLNRHQANMRNLINYQPHSTNDDINSYYSSRTYAYRNNAQNKTSVAGSTRYQPWNRDNLYGSLKDHGSFYSTASKTNKRAVRHSNMKSNNNNNNNNDDDTRSCYSLFGGPKSAMSSRSRYQGPKNSSSSLMNAKEIYNIIMDEGQEENEENEEDKGLISETRSRAGRNEYLGAGSGRNYHRSRRPSRTGSAVTAASRYSVRNNRDASAADNGNSGGFISKMFGW